MLRLFISISCLLLILCLSVLFVEFQKKVAIPMEELSATVLQPESVPNPNSFPTKVRFHYEIPQKFKEKISNHYGLQWYSIIKNPCVKTSCPTEVKYIRPISLVKENDTYTMVNINGEHISFTDYKEVGLYGLLELKETKGTVEISFEKYNDFKTFMNDGNNLGIWIGKY